MKLENLEIRRLSVHKLYGKSKSNNTPYAGDCKELCRLGNEAMETLHKRVESCLNHKSKFYELDLLEKGKESFYEIQKALHGAREKHFLEISQKLADKAAESHLTANIPDGLLLLLEAKISGFNSSIVVKAERSHAFSIAGNDLQLVKDIFLSSDKTLYKVGFCIKKDNSNSDEKAYRFYVYDDAFSPSKDDLAHYFYNNFLGLTTEKNSKLLTNNLYKALKNFANDHIDLGDKYEVMRAIDRFFLDQKNNNLNSSDFKSFFPYELEQLYESSIEIDFPFSFVKDNSIINSIDSKRIALTPETTLLLKNAPDGIITGSTRVKNDMDKLRVSIDSGQHFSFALVPSVSVGDFDKGLTKK